MLIGPRAPAGSRRPRPRSGRWPKRVKKPLSGLEIGLDRLLDVLDREGAWELLAIDEEGRGGIDAELLRCPRTHVLDAIEELLILQALVEALLAQPSLLGDGKERLQRPLHHPIPLLGKQRLDHRVVALRRRLRDLRIGRSRADGLGRAARQHEACGGKLVEWEFAEDEANLAGVDVALLELRIGGLMEVGAMRAGH